MGERTFLVESFVPELDEATAAAISSRVRTTLSELQEEGLALGWVVSFALVEEETYLCLVGAIDLEVIVRLSEQAGLTSAHVVEVVALDPDSSVEEDPRKGR